MLPSSIAISNGQNDIAGRGSVVATSLQTAPAFEDEREHSSFLYFQQESVQNISGTHDSSLWDHLILQTCRNDVSARRLLVALGALTKARKMNQSPILYRRNTNSSISQSRDIEAYAFRQYGRALRGLQKDSHGVKGLGQVQARRTMLISLLIFTFESVSGFQDCAINQMNAALRLTDTQFASETRRYKHLGTATSSQTLEQDLLSALVRIDQALMSRGTRTMIDEVPDFENVESVIRPPTRQLSVNLGQTVLQIPERFENVMDGRKTIEYIQFWALPQIISKFFIGSEERKKGVDAHTKKVCEAVLSQLRDFQKAFQPLLDNVSHYKKGSRQYNALLIPRLQSLSFGLATKQILYRGQEYDPTGMQRDAAEMITICETIVSDPNLYRGFVFECEFLPPLFVISTSVVGTEYRFKALDLLKRSIPRQESGWDTVTMVRVAEDMLAAEKEHRTLLQRYEDANRLFHTAESITFLEK